MTNPRDFGIKLARGEFLGYGYTTGDTPIGIGRRGELNKMEMAREYGVPTLLGAGAGAGLGSIAKDYLGDDLPVDPRLIGAGLGGILGAYAGHRGANELRNRPELFDTSRFVNGKVKMLAPESIPYQENQGPHAAFLARHQASDRGLNKQAAIDSSTVVKALRMVADEGLRTAPVAGRFTVGRNAGKLMGRGVPGQLYEGLHTVLRNLSDKEKITLMGAAGGAAGFPLGMGINRGLLQD